MVQQRAASVTGGVDSLCRDRTEEAWHGRMKAGMGQDYSSYKLRWGTTIGDE